NQYIIIEDFFPTILDIAGIKKARTVQKTDGLSFTRSLKNPSCKDSERSLLWHYPNKWIPKGGPGISWTSAIRQGDWKLIYNFKEKAVELYNLRADLGERNNLASTEPLKAKELKRLLTKKLKKLKAQMPENKITGKRINYPDEL